MYFNSNWKGRLVAKCLENGIAVYSPHTAWDNTRNGIGDWLCNVLPHTQSIIIKENAKNSAYGSGRFAIVPSDETVTLAMAMDKVKKHLGISNVHLAIGVDQSLDSLIKSFAVCPGSGNSVLKDYDADLYITGKHAYIGIVASSFISRLAVIAK